MSSRMIYVRSLIASWAGYGGSIIVLFFLTPFVVHHLGKSQYGVWLLLNTVTGYLGLAEIGVRVSTGRYINYYLGKGRPGRAGSVVSTSLVFYSIISVAILAVVGVLGLIFGDLFGKVPADLARQARWIAPLLGLNIWLSFFSSSFAQLLTANNRFDLKNIVALGTLGLRAVGTVLILQAGHGLVALAAIAAGSSLLGVVLLGWLARTYGPAVPVNPRYASWAVFREMFSYGSWAFVSNVSTRVILYAGTVLTGVMVGSEEIAIYGIGLMIIDYARDFVAYVVRIVTPDIQKSAAREPARLRDLMVRASNATMFLVVPMFVGFIVLGQEFIRNWMTSELTDAEVVTSAKILLILTLPHFGMMANLPCDTVLQAAGHVRLMAALKAAEAGGTVLIGAALAGLFDLGVEGIALGMLVSTGIVNNIGLMYFGCRRIGLPVGDYFRSTWLRWLPLVAGFALLLVTVSAGVDRMVAPGSRGWLSFWGKVFLSAALYAPVGAVVLIGRDELVATWRKMHGGVKHAPSLVFPGAPGRTKPGDLAKHRVEQEV